MPQDPPKVYVCRGGDCRDDRRAHRALVAALEPVADVRLVGCQGLCDGPVAGLRTRGRLEWFERLGKRRAREAFAALAARAGDAELPDRLRKRRVRKRSGKRPK